MAAYAALVSLSQTTHLNRYQGSDLFSIEVENKIRSIHEYALYLQTFLEEFPQKAKRWEGRIRDLAHEAEDFIDDFMWLRIQPHHQGRRTSLPNLEEQLQNVTEKFGLMAGDVMDERPSDKPAAVSSSLRLAPTGNDAVIGLDDDLITIRGRLCGEPSHLLVIPIVGMGGIGKTTLARIVYDDQSVLDHFDFRAWITVSQDYDSKHSLRKILLGLIESINLLEEFVSRKKIDEFERYKEVRQTSNKQLENIAVSEMATQVFQNLKYRRYLIVIDDVWSTEVWDDLMIFPDDGNGSRILLTTRLSEVASYPHCHSPIYEMQVMNDAQSWELLKQKVLRDRYCPPHLIGVGEEIARSCAGLPLAVVLVAGLLSAVSSTPASWREIARNVNRVVDRKLDEILSLSYTHLPHHLRPCFLYLGGFPEDENIPASRIMKLWEAEGFLKYANESNKSLEEEAEEYLEDLVRRNLVFVNNRKINGKIRSCSLHDTVRDLCIRKALEEKFLSVMDKTVDLHYLIDERRFSLMGPSDIDCLLVRTIRTILIFNLRHFAIQLLRSLGHFRLLRVLHAPSLNPQEFSSQVFKLIHLRYLALDGLNISSAISKLVNLETLIIQLTSHPKKKRWGYYPKYAPCFSLPLEIWRMQQLKHLIFYGRYTLPHPPESNLPLTNLQTLSLVENLLWNEKVVQMIPNVKRLGLVYSNHQDYHLHHFKNLLQLENLRVILCWKSSWVGQVPTFPTTLKKLSLAGGGFPWSDMSIIGSLPNLQVLKLLDYACYGATWETCDEEFPQLKYLVIDTSCLQHWVMESSSFPILERLVLRCCRNLEKIPEEIGEISTLELIEVGDCSNSVVESAKEIKEYQQSCGNDALQVRCIVSDNTRLDEMKAG